MSDAANTPQREISSVEGTTNSTSSSLSTMDADEARLTGFDGLSFPESRSWGFVPDPLHFRLTDGTDAGSMNLLKYTIVRAEKNGARVCYMTFQFNWHSYWGRTNWGNNPPLRIKLWPLTKDGGKLDEWHVADIHLECWQSNIPKFYRRDFSPDTFKLIEGATFSVSGSSLIRCS